MTTHYVSTKHGDLAYIDEGSGPATLQHPDGPASDRPFVPPVSYSAIGYGVRPSNDPVAKLRRDIEDGKIQHYQVTLKIGFTIDDSTIGA